MGIYLVDVEGIGVVRKRADTIEEARGWARQAFRPKRTSVRIERTVKRCQACDSAPCCCPARRTTP